MTPTFRIDVDGLLRAFDELPEALDRHGTEALGAAAIEVADGARREHDYVDRTGHLTASIQPGEVAGTFLGGMSVDITAGGLGGVDYARHIEEGTKHIEPRRFLAMSLERNEQVAGRLLEEGIQDAFDEVGL